MLTFVELQNLETLHCIVWGACKAGKLSAAILWIDWQYIIDPSLSLGAVCQPWYCHICQLRKARKSIKQIQRILQTRACFNGFACVWVCWSWCLLPGFDMLRIFQSVRGYEYQNKWQTINKGRYAGGGYSGGKVGTRQGEKCKKMQLRNTGGGAGKCNKGAKMQAAAGRK